MSDDNPLTPDEAAVIVGVPVHQLMLWAWATTRHHQVGPRHVGTRVKPMYHREDLDEWLERRCTESNT